MVANKSSTGASPEDRLDIVASGIDSDMQHYKAMKMTRAEVSFIVPVDRGLFILPPPLEKALCASMLRRIFHGGEAAKFGC